MDNGFCKLCAETSMFNLFHFIKHQETIHSRPTKTKRTAQARQGGDTTPGVHNLARKTQTSNRTPSTPAATPLQRQEPFGYTHKVSVKNFSCGCLLRHSQPPKQYLTFTEVLLSQYLLKK